MFVRIRINRVLAIIITLLLTFLVIAASGTLLFSQASRFTASLPEVADKFTDTLNQLIVFVSGRFNLSNKEITEWITQAKDGLMGSLEVGETIASVGSVVAFFFLIPVYLFMILFYQPLIIEFLYRVFDRSHRSTVSEVINSIKSLIQHYLLGLLLQVAIISTLYSIGLLILGIKYAILIGVIGAFLNLLPYLGSIIAASIPMVIALVTKSSPWFALLVLGVYVFIQFLDNNFITPKIVGSKVKLNALASIISVVVFAALWGIPGMVLAIPLTAIAKLIFDHIEPLQPWGFLLGDNLTQDTVKEDSKNIKT